MAQPARASLDDSHPVDRPRANIGLMSAFPSALEASLGGASFCSSQSSVRLLEIGHSVQQ